MRKILRGHVFNINFLFTLCLGFAFSATHAQVHGIFTINSAVATGGSNFQTFSAAAASLSGGVDGPVTFNVQAFSGPYNEQVVLNNITGTDATNTITFNCNGVTLTFLSIDPLSRAGVKINNTDYVTFDNLRVEPQAANTDEFGYGFHLLNDADHNTIQNCHIINNLNWDVPQRTCGIVINGNDGDPSASGNSNCDDNLIQQNIIEGSGIAVSLSSIPASGTVQFMNGNKVIRNSISNWWLNGIELYNTSNTQVDGNDLTGGPIMYQFAGIHLDEANHKAAIINNRIHDIAIDVFAFIGSEIYGIRNNSTSVAGQENLIANNAIYNWVSDALQRGIVSDGGTFFNVYHNTISLDDQSMSGDYTRGVSLENISDVNFMNNIVTVTRKGTVESFGIYVNNAQSVFNCDHNVFYAPVLPLPAKNVLGLWKGNFAVNLASWRTQSGKDLFSAEFNPLYVNLAAGNLTPTVQNIDNLGVNVNVSSDISNITRSTINPDPGCYEFTSAACATTVTPGSLMISPDSVLCQGPQVSMGLNGNSAGNGQTYTWQSSTTQAGTYTNVSSALNYPYYQVTPLTTLYYRVAVTCGTSTQYSSPMKVLVTNPLNGGTYTINNALPTGGVNFNSFTDAVKSLQCGINGSVVFNVASGSGPYLEQMTIPAVNTAPNRTVTFNGNGATIGFTTTNAKATVVRLDGADYITIDSLKVEVQGATTGIGIGIMLTRDADNNTIKRCTVNLNKTSTSVNYAGIAMCATDNDPVNDVDTSYCDNNLITNNTVIGGYYGITCASTANLTVLIPTSNGNIIRNNTLLDNCNIGIWVTGTGSLLVDSNDISLPTRTVFGTSQWEGIRVNKMNFGLTITKNRIHDLFVKAQRSVNQVSGITFVTVTGAPAQPNMVSNNLIYNFKGLGLQEGLYTLNSSYVKFYHNSISLEDTSARDAIKETRGFGMFGGDSSGVEFKNNNIVIRRGGFSEKYGIYLDKADSNLVANYNNYYMRSPEGKDTMGSMGHLIYKTLNNWLFTRKDSGSINIDPVYNDLAKGDLTPTKITFENKGFNVGITTDLLNNMRNTTTPDIGAIEFTICSPLTNPVVTIEDAQPNIVKFAWNRITNSTGYRVSRDNLNWIIPSSGAQGLTHTVTGLKSTDTVTLWVKALGTRADCPDYTSLKGAKALSDGVFVPNTFTPNGDSHNDVFQVYSAIAKSIRWMVFNQWGEKVFESNDINGAWDGTYKGKPQPVGVYVYVVSGVLSNGTKVSKKGTFNLVR